MRGDRLAIAQGEYARAVLHAALGRYTSALAAAQRACEHEYVGLHNWALTELVEVAVRAGERTTATVALKQLADRTRAAGTAWALGIEARSRALLSDEPDGLYQEAIDRLSGTRITLQLARTRLLYGEWLRREGRTIDARGKLGTAHDAFATAGAEGFAERTRREFAATGGSVRMPSIQTRDQLTPQEAQIAELAAAGRTNPEIGAELSIIARTVEWHLRKVFAKLGITSRRDLPVILR